MMQPYKRLSNLKFEKMRRLKMIDIAKNKRKELHNAAIQKTRQFEI